MGFEFATAGRIVFGAGSLREAVAAAGRRPLLVTGASRRFSDRFPSATVFPVTGEPTVDGVRQGVALSRANTCDSVIAIGGGSVIDAAKAIAILTTNSGEPLDYLEVVGRGQTFSNPPLPFIAVPTTAGTGSEVTRNAVLASEEHKVKASLRSPMMLPKLAVIDPELTLSLPKPVTAATGLDALTQLIEPFVSLRANPMTDAICVEGIRREARSLETAWRDGANLDARTDMSFASLCGGLALANAGLGAAHGFAAPIGGMFDAPHGAVCAALLPHVMQANLPAARERYEIVARLLTGKSDASAEDGAAWVASLVRHLEIPPLRCYGITEQHLPVLVEKAQKASSMKANPVVLSPQSLTAILQAAL